MNALNIVNVISSFKLQNGIELKKIYHAKQGISTFDETVFNYNVVVMRLKDPKMTFLIYATGTVICTGANTINNGNRAYEIFKKQLNGVISDFRLKRELTIDNIVSIYDSNREIDLAKITSELNHNNVEYEPEQFPGLIYRFENPKGTALIFKSGKIVISGTKTEDDIKKIITELSKQIAPMVI